MSKASYKKPFLVIFLIVATELIGFGLIIPILPQLSLQFNVSSFMVGLLLAAYSFAQFLAAPLLGALSDRFGRKPILVLSKLGTVAAYLLLAFSQSYVWFLVARLLDGFTGGNISVARAYLADITAPEDRPKGMAIIGISFGVGFLLGPALGGLLYSDGLAHQLAAFVAAGLSALAMLLTIVLLKEPENRQAATSAMRGLASGLSKLRHPAVILVLLAQFVYMLIFSGFEVTLSVFTQFAYDFNLKENSWLFVYVGLIAMLVQGGLARRAPKKLKGATLFGFVIAALSFAMIGSSSSTGGLYVGVGFLALGLGLVNVYLPSLLSLFTTDENRGSLMGVYEGISSLSRVIAPILVYTSFMESLRDGYLLFGGILALVMLLLLLGLKLPNTEVKSNES